MGKSFLDYMGFIQTSIGTVLSAIGIYLSLSSDIPLASLATKLIIGLMIASVVFLFLFLLFLNQYLFHKRYTKAYSIINDALACSHRLRDSEDINNLKDCLHGLEEFCTSIAEAFKTFANRQAFVCIKYCQATDNESDIMLKTFCRDRSISSMERAKHDNEDIDEKRVHLLAYNTDFQHIFNNKSSAEEYYKYYFSNTLPFKNDYKNSRIKPGFPMNMPKILRCIFWPLPYKSTIIVPIIPLTKTGKVKEIIIGFLCVDSKSMWAFSKQHDVEILRGLADGLYPTMKIIINKHFSPNEF
jgi:hypothetical protein